jgi:biopolymer transport protein ExbD
MTALAAILFVLITAFAVHPVAHLPIELAVDLPPTNHAIAIADGLGQNSLFITVTRDDRIFLGRESLEPQSLSQAIRDRLSYGAERRVYVRVDKRAHYGTVKKALEGVRAAGMEHVAFLVDEPSSQSGRPHSNR